ncbi:PepSY domain-containing protein [Paenibacillus sonchi]|uniref:PepSY domain-containing protein n=3 Tax=Paenibacillus sonchi TaxID=373687 RepID=A0A974SGC8_9BACL|nr:PepSY domain-containing protein [Paenibacillus sonchi]QQZ63355.1 PepSY domain-containing protein [Paenibacillus sonchi]
MRNKQPVNPKLLPRVLWGIAAVVLMLSFGFRIFAPESPQLLTSEEAKQHVLDEYAGNIVSLSLHSGKYVAELETAQGRYELKLDGATGEVTSIVQLEAAATPPVPPTPQPSSVPPTAAAESEPPSAAPQRVVSEKEAVELALREVPGELDDVDTGINESGAFYLVEINTSDKREAVVQVDAISGSIMSVTWENQDEDNS